MKIHSQLYDAFTQIRADLAEVVPEYRDRFTESDLYSHIGWRNPWIATRYGASWPK